MKLVFVINKESDKSYAKDPKIIEYIDEQYKSKSQIKSLETAKKQYQKSWNEINDEFSDYVEKITGYKWFYPKYECIISVFHRGISSWGNKPRIVRIFNEDPTKMRRTTGHELILSHYFEIYKRNYKQEGLTDGQVWALAEIAAFALTSLDPTVEKFWLGDTEYYINHNYSHIIDLQLKLKDIFLKRKDFNEYILKGIELVRKYPEMNSKGIS